MGVRRLIFETLAQIAAPASAPAPDATPTPGSQHGGWLGRIVGGLRS